MLVILCMLQFSAAASSDYKDRKEEWLRKAEEAKPVLHKTVCRPVSMVQAVEDASAFQGWRMEQIGEVPEYYGASINEMPDVTVDFGRHMTGYFTFRRQVTDGVPKANWRACATIISPP